MKKTLLLAAALACSGVAQAENYICDGKVGSVIEMDKVTVSLVDADFLISTTAGFKRTGPNQIYSGKCQMESADDNSVNAIICNHFSPFAADLIMMNLESLRFTRTLTFAGNSYVWTGQCSEI